jgi:hypothetical protein
MFDVQLVAVKVQGSGTRMQDTGSWIPVTEIEVSTKHRRKLK